MSAPFVIFSLPRSRSYWLSRFLSTAGWTCHHDPVAKIAEFEPIRRLLSNPKTGVADTGIAHGADLVRQVFPQARFAVVRRPLVEVRASIEKLGIDPAHTDLEALDRHLDEIAADPSTLCLTFEQLDDEAMVKRLYEFCLEGAPWDQRWWEHWRHRNVQIDMPARVQMLIRHREKLQALRRYVQGGSGVYPL